MKLSHVAIACPQIQSVASKLKAIELEIEKTVEIATEGVRAAFIPVEVSSEFRIELLESTSKDSAIHRFLETRPKGGLHHLSFEVDNIETWKGRLDAAGIEVVSPGIRQAARGRALFIHPREMGGVLVELEEKF